ncbi:MAG: hypothetical protein A4E67_00978 [Syntrophaceae bacterium PtaB.Bin038]|nr:MAG: hypothetical protein A4E67_00978 [Syntrophaceae bacterium PtaB.Bin038]
MLSWPPAITISARPVWIICTARSIVLMPDEQTLFTVIEGTNSGRPASSVAWRLGTCPQPAGTTCPMNT